MCDTPGLWQHEDMPCGERWRTPGREDWYCEVWDTPGLGYRYAFHCTHTTPNPKMPEAEWLRLRENVGFGCAGARCGVMLRGFLGRRSCRSW